MPGPLALGAYPQGSPKALTTLADDLRKKGDEAARKCLDLQSVPLALVFIGSAGDRYRRYANATGRSAESVRSAFYAAARSAESDAQDLKDAQKAWHDRKDEIDRYLEDEAKRAKEAAKTP